MNPALGAALSGLMASQTRLDVHGNNIANANTTAFKSSRVTQSEVDGLNGTQVSGITKDNSQGALESTGFASDKALVGPGHFVVEAYGRAAQTRDGSFSTNPAGETVTAGGARLTETVGEVEEGYLESSNTDLATEMVGLITSQRGFEANLATIRTQDKMLGSLLDILA